VKDPIEEGETPTEKSPVEIETPIATPEKELDDETQIDESSIPDWLKQDFGTIDEAEKTVKENSDTEIVDTPEQDNAVEEMSPEKIEDDDASVPDWLK